MDSIQQISSLKAQQLSDKLFLKLSRFIEENYGIKMPQAKKTMLESRLKKRLKVKQIGTFEDYCEYLFSKEGMSSELIHMVDVVSTNKTDFFREMGHFDYMTEHWLPEMYKKTSGKLKIWSSASSSGEELYSIAMTISEYADTNGYRDYEILGTDISSEILKKAQLAVYAPDKAAVVPYALKKKYFLKSKNQQTPTVRLIKSIRDKTYYKRLNLMDDHYGIEGQFDLIFCRNVLIYFDRSNQEKVVNRLCRHLKPGGTLFLGHSESLMGMDVPLKQIKPTIYIKL